MWNQTPSSTERPCAGQTGESSVEDVEANLSWRRLKRLVREDFQANDAGWFHPGFHAVAVYRFGRWVRGLAQPSRLLASLLYKTLYVLVRNVYGIEIPASARIGRRLHIAHQGGIVVHPRTTIGDDCLLRQNCTIGVATPGRMVPTIGDRVQVGAGAVLVGEISVGDDARIGPNAVVMSDVPAGGSAFAPAARIIRPKVSEREQTAEVKEPSRSVDTR